MFRLARKGVRVADGSRVRLEAVRVGSVGFTSRGAVGRFVAALSCPADGPIPPRPPAARRRVSEAAAAERQHRGA